MFKHIITVEFWHSLRRKEFLWLRGGHVEFQIAPLLCYSPQGEACPAFLTTEIKSEIFPYRQLIAPGRGVITGIPPPSLKSNLYTILCVPVKIRNQIIVETARINVGSKWLLNQNVLLQFILSWSCFLFLQGNNCQLQLHLF